MTEFHPRAPASSRYAPHAFRGSPVESRRRTASVDSPPGIRRRLEETHHVDTRKAAFRDRYSTHHYHLAVSPPQRAVAPPSAPTRDFANVPFDLSTQRQLSHFPVTNHSQALARRQARTDADVPSAHRSRFASSSNPRIHLSTVFGDVSESSSVVMGMSEQELLRTAARDEDRRRRHRHKINRRNKQQATIQFPSYLSHDHVLYKTSYYGHMDGAAELEFRTGTPSAMQESELSSYQPRIDDIDQTTADAMRSPDPPRLSPAHSSRARSANNYGTPSLYSTLPAQQAVVNEADGDSILLWQPSQEQDLQSIESFPILSKHYGLTVGVSALDSSIPVSTSTRTDKEISISHSSYPAGESTGGGTCGIGIGSPPPRRAVRFAHQAAIPRYESEDNAVKMTRDIGTVWKQDDPAVVTPTWTNGITPKSILRTTRFSVASPAPRTSAAYYAQIQAFREKYHRQTQQENDLVHRNKGASIDKSPPQNGSFFVYPNGDDELSPIPANPKYSYRHNYSQDDVAGSNIQATSSYARVYVTNQTVVEYRNPPTIVRFGHDVAQETPSHDSDSKASDHAPLPEWYESLDEIDAGAAGDEEEAGSMSTTSFTQTVAAIVIQAIFRRYRVQWIYSDVLARRRLQRQRFERHCDLYNEPVRTEALPEDTDQLVAYLTYDKTTRNPDDAVQSNDKNQKIAAMKIQATFRGYWVRDCLSVDSYCATLIQKSWRSHRALHTFLFTVYSIILIQSLYRRHRVRAHFHQQSCAAIIIQKMIRGHRTRKGLRGIKRKENTTPVIASNSKQPVEKTLQRRAMFAKLMKQKREKIHRAEAQTKASMKIQKHWRRCHYEQKYKKILMGILKIQTFVRRWAACRRVANMRSLQTASSFSNSSFQSSAASRNSHAGDDSHVFDECPCTRSVIDMWQQRMMRSGGR